MVSAHYDLAGGHGGREVRVPADADALTQHAAVWALRKLYSRAKAVVIYAFYENRDTPGHLRLDLVTSQLTRAIGNVRSRTEREQHGYRE